jgi:hypothetical protein
VTLLVYAIAERDGSAAPELELGGRRLRGVADGELVAFVGEGAPPEPDRGVAEILGHERIVELLMGRQTILPVRFDSGLSDEPQIRSLLRERRLELAAALERVRGAVELGVRAQWRERGRVEPEDAPRTGTDYLLERLAIHKRADAVARGLDRLAGFARLSRIRVLPRPALPFLGAYLVEEARVTAFAGACAELDDGLDDVELVCTGPWPPYSFAGGPGG